MDFLRPRAIPALIALALAQPAAADCSVLDGTYRYKADVEEVSATSSLGNLVAGPDRQRLYKIDRASAPKGLSPDGLMTRPKITPLATAVTLTYRAEGTKLRFLDADGKPIADFGINSDGRWACKGTQLERRFDRMSGVGDSIREERIEQSLAREGEALLFRELVTPIDPPGGKPGRVESRFRLAR